MKRMSLHLKTGEFPTLSPEDEEEFFDYAERHDTRISYCQSYLSYLAEEKRRKIKEEKERVAYEKEQERRRIKWEEDKKRDAEKLKQIIAEAEKGRKARQREAEEARLQLYGDSFLTVDCTEEAKKVYGTPFVTPEQISRVKAMLEFRLRDTRLARVNQSKVDNLI